MMLRGRNGKHGGKIVAFRYNLVMLIFGSMLSVFPAATIVMYLDFLCARQKGEVTRVQNYG